MIYSPENASCPYCQCELLSPRAPFCAFCCAELTPEPPFGAALLRHTRGLWWQIPAACAAAWAFVVLILGGLG